MTTEIITVFIQASGLVVIVVQLYFIMKTLNADHERRRKQSTIEYMNQIRDIYRSVDRKLTEKYGKKSLNPEDVEKADMADLREFLSVLEHLSVGVNTGVYDVNLVNRMSGTFLLHTHDRVRPYINHARKERDSKTLYQEFGAMCRKIRDIREHLPSDGDIVHSKNT